MDEAEDGEEDIDRSENEDELLEDYLSSVDK